MKAILLTKKSSFQYYCANKLYDLGMLDEVIFETGSSVPENNNLQIKSILMYLRRFCNELKLRPRKLFSNSILRLKLSKYYGNKEYHDKRILRSDYESLQATISRKEYDSINNKECIQYIRNSNPDIVYVFGTGLICQDVFDGTDIPFVNLHWGLSPYYRGEGIVTALAFDGIKSLGVTVHLLSKGIDSGNILSRERINCIEHLDNFYSIGLKLTVKGVSLLSECYELIRSGQALAGVKQDLNEGRLYSSKVMLNNPQYYSLAWDNLKLLK